MASHRGISVPTPLLRFERARASCPGASNAKRPPVRPTLPSCWTAAGAELTASFLLIAKALRWTSLRGKAPNRFCGAVSQRLQQHARARVRVVRQGVSLDEFDILDANGDGVLTRDEFAARETLQKRSEDDSLEVALERYREFLTTQEETGPLWYRVADSSLTALGTICFVTRVVDPDVAGVYHLRELEDIVNVSFFVKFLLLFWLNDFKWGWLLTGKGALDLASCLPVLCIPGRLVGGPQLERTADLLQIGRFLRLLREALPSDSNAGPGGAIRIVPVTQQITAVLLSLLGTVIVSATVLFSFENPMDQAIVERSFEDALIYMVNIFAGRDPPWYPVNPQAKIASVLASCSGILFIPFLVARSVELFMPAQTRNQMDNLLVTGSQAEDYSKWVETLRRLDKLDEAGLFTAEESRQLRRLCLAEDRRLAILDRCYSDCCNDPPDETARRRYASRLRELLVGPNPEM